MTVKEMIDRLETMPLNALVVVHDWEHGVTSIARLDVDPLPVQSLVYVVTEPDKRETR